MSNDLTIIIYGKDYTSLDEVYYRVLDNKGKPLKDPKNLSDVVKCRNIIKGYYDALDDYFNIKDNETDVERIKKLKDFNNEQGNSLINELKEIQEKYCYRIKLLEIKKKALESDLESITVKKRKGEFKKNKKEIEKDIKDEKENLNLPVPDIKNLDDVVKKIDIIKDSITKEDFSKLEDRKNKLEEWVNSLSSQIELSKKLIEGLLDKLQKDISEPKEKGSDNILMIGKSEGTREDSFQFKSYNSQNELCFGNIVGIVSKADYELNNNDSSDGEGKKNGKKVYNDLFGQSVFGKSDSTSVTIRLEIYSRFDDIDNIVMNNKAPFFLISLLRRAKKLNPTGRDYESSYDWNSLFDFFLIILIRKTLKEALAKGFFRQYQRFNVNSEKVRGSIDIARHIRLNAGINNGKVACSYRENTLDNMVNHLLFAALDSLESRYPGILNENLDAESIQRLNALKYEIGYPKYDRRTIIAKNLIPVSHPFYYDYRDLQRYCLMVLRDEGVSPFGYDNEAVEGILFYVDDLWEEYIESYLKDALKDINSDEEAKTELKIFSQKKINKLCSIEESYVDNIGEEEKIPHNESRPDFVYGYKCNDSYKAFFILDAKYRPQWAMALHGKLNNEFLGGDYDKCLRDMVSIEAMSAAVMFPIGEDEYKKEIEEANKESEKIQFAHLFSKHNRCGRFYTFPIPIPSTKEIENYRDWKEMLKDRLLPFFKCPNDYIDLECKKAQKYNELQKEINKDMDDYNKQIREMKLPTNVDNETVTD